VIGIDIVDLTDPKLKIRNARSKKLVLNESEIIPDLPNFFWLYWTAKEAVFKGGRKPINFQPKSIIIDWNFDDLTFRSSFQGINLQGQCMIEQDYVLSYCHIPNLKINFSIHKNDSGKNWSDKIRTFLIDDFKKQNRDVQIAKDEYGLPIIQPTNLPISISHHYRKGAYIYPDWMI